MAGLAPALGGGAELDADAVADYLRLHPPFLADHPGLYDTLQPPCRVHEAVLADHMAAMLLRARSRAVEVERASAQSAAGRRAAEGFARRVHETVLALMRAPDPAWLATHELAGILRVDAARVCSEASRPSAGAVTVPRGTVAGVLGHRAVLVRLAGPEAMQDAAYPGALLHGEAVALAAQEALVRVPLMSGPALLAVACRDARGLEGAGTDILAFLGQAIGAALERRQVV